MSFIKNLKRPFRNRASTALSVFIIVIVAAYAVFFTSNLWMPKHGAGDESAAKIGAEITYGDSRGITLISAQHDPEQRMLELVFTATNSSGDGINDYYYAVDLLPGNPDKVEIEEVFSSPLITVIRLHGIKKFEEVDFILAPKTKERSEITSSDIGIVVLTKSNVQLPEGGIKNKTADEYQIDRYKALTASYTAEKEVLKNEISGKKDRIAALENENKSLVDNMPLLLESERKSAEEKIARNEEHIQNLRKEIEEHTREVEKADEKIADALAKTAALSEVA